MYAKKLVSPLRVTHLHLDDQPQHPSVPISTKQPHTNADPHKHLQDPSPHSARLRLSVTLQIKDILRQDQLQLLPFKPSPLFVVSQEALTPGKVSLQFLKVVS